VAIAGKDKGARSAWGRARELDAAMLLNVGLLDRVHVAFQLRDLLSARGVPLYEEQCRLEQHSTNPRCDRIVVRLLILRAARLRGPRGYARRFLLKLRA
jgi:hypothetical protein